MIVAVPKETALNERRVALVPETVQRLVKSGVEVRVARGAGVSAAFPDDEYVKAGASIVDDPAALLSAADAVVTVNLNSPRAFLRWARGRCEQRLSGPPWYTTWSWRHAKESVAFVEQLGPLVVGSGHGLPMSGVGVTQALRGLADRYGASGIGSDRGL